MSTALSADARIQSVTINDGLSEATPEQHSHFEIPGSGSGIRWPDIDEDISVAGMLYGIPARKPAR